MEDVFGQGNQRAAVWHYNARESRAEVCECDATADRAIISRIRVLRLGMISYSCNWLREHGDGSENSFEGSAAR
eukprot:364958-Amphidinium_carterae.2